MKEGISVTRMPSSKGDSLTQKGIPWLQRGFPDSRGDSLTPLLVKSYTPVQTPTPMSLPYGKVIVKCTTIYVAVKFFLSNQNSLCLFVGY